MFSIGCAIWSEKKPAWGVDDAIAKMKIIDAFIKCEKSKKWQKVG